MSTDNKSTIKICILIVMALLFLFSLQSASASTITNSTEGGISKAISDISNGGTLYLDDGMYRIDDTNDTNITIDKNVTIKGSGDFTIIFIGSNDIAFNVENGNTLTLYNMTIISNYTYTEDDIANYDSLINLHNGSISGSGSVLFENCKFINEKQTDAEITVSASSTYSSGNVILTAIAKDVNGNNLNGNVAFYIDNEFSGRVPIVNGLATYSLNLPNGNYVVHASYTGNGDINYKSSQNILSFNVNALFSPAYVPLPTSGTRYYVSPNGNDSNNGQDPNTPKQTVVNAYNTAVSASADNFYIILGSGSYSSSGNVGLTTNRNVTFIGNTTGGNVTFNPGTNNRFITISNGSSTNRRTVNVSNVNFRGNTPSSTNVPIITLNTYTILNVNYVHFMNISASTAGPAIYSGANQVTVNINYTNMTNINTSSQGGAIKFAGNGNNVFLTINNSNFDTINATYGGVIHGNPTNVSMDIYNSNFNNCYASVHGGVACGDGRYVRFYNSNFTNVRASNNTTDSGATAGGGALYIHQSTSGEASMAINCTFINSTSHASGGAVFADGGASMIIEDSEFYNSSSRMRGGAIYANGGNVTVYDSYFEGNYVLGSSSIQVYGGALAAIGASTISIYNSEFFNNSARNNSTSVTYGGVAAVNNISAVINLVNCTIRDNWARYGGAFGTGSGGGRINVINNTAIYNNYALEYGGVAGLGSAGTIIINNSHLYNNSAGTFGGAFGVNGAGTINATNSNLTDNKANSTFGGAVGLNGAGTINLNWVNMFDNIAVTYGGAIGVSGTGGTVNVRNSTFKRNRANGTTSTTGYGGAIGLTSGNINVYDSLFSNNTAANYGGAVGVPTGGNFYAHQSVFEDNVAGTYGGAIGSAAGVNISYCNFTNNIAGTNGGAVAALHTTANNYIYSCQFEFNTAVGTSPNGLGNAIYASNHLTANYNRFFNNSGNTPGNFANTLWTNATTSNQQYVNIDFNWWGDNAHYAVGNLPRNYVMVDFDVNNADLYNGTAHYLYTIRVNDSNSSFNPNNLPPFFGVVTLSPPNENLSHNFSAHENGNIIKVPFTDEGYQSGSFRVDNWYLSFNKSTNTTLNVTLGNTTGKYTDDVTLNATFLDRRGYAVNGLVVDFYVAGIYVGTGTTNSNGFVSIYPYNVISAGNLNYIVGYNGSNKNYNPINVSRILTFDRLNTSIVANNYTNGSSGQNVVLNATIRDEKGRPVENVTITFHNGSNAASLGTAITNSLGQAMINYAFATTGNYTWYATFAGNGNYSPSNSSANGLGRVEKFAVVNLTIVKSSNATGVVNFGDHVLYTINVTNYGPDTATGVVVQDNLDSRLIFITSTPLGSYNSNTGIWNVGNVTAGQSVVLTIEVRINGTGNIPNFANITSTHPDVGNNNSSSSNITVNDTVYLTITKSSNVTTAAYGDYVRYTINVRNNGPDNATNVVVMDVLHASLIFNGSTANVGSYNPTTSLWTIGNLAINQTATLDITVIINGTGTIPNIANVTVNELNLGNNSTNGTNVTVPKTVNLSITKTINVTGDSALGDYVRYTIRVYNHGPDNATNVNVTDELDPRLQFNSTTPITGVTVTGNTVIWNIGTLNVGQTVELNITVRIIDTGIIYNVATVNVSEVNIGNNSSGNDTNITVPATVNFTITKGINTTTAKYLDYISYTINVTNHGPDTASYVVVNDKLDDRLRFINATLGTYNPTTGVWNVGNLTMGQTVTLVITAQIIGTGDIPNVANVSAGQPNVGNNSTSSDNVSVPATVNLTISKTTNASSNASYLDIIRYTITVTNHGPDTATGVVVMDQLDSRLAYLSQSATPGTGVYNPTTGVWSVGNLTMGQTVTLNITVQINATGNITNVANVTTGQENIGENKTNDTNVSVPKTVNLTLTKTSNVTGNATVGTVIGYIITLTNNGPDNATGVNVTDKLDAGLLYINHSLPSANYNNITGVWTIGNLNVGASVQLNITAVIVGTGTIPNVATVVVNEVNIGNNTTDGNTTVTVPSSVDFTITKTSNATTANYLDLVSYTIYIRNNGPDNATGVAILDKLDYRLVLVNSTSNRGTYNPTTGEWSIGNLLVGQDATLTIIARINGTGNIPNVANVSSNQESIGDNSSNATVSVGNTTNLTITKISNVTGNANYLDFVRYTITVYNHGPDMATGVSVIDNLDPRLALISQSATIGTYTAGVWSIGTLNAGQTVTLTINVQIIGTGNISNVAIINATGNQTDIGDKSNDSSNVTVPDTVNLTLTKTSNVTGNTTVGTLVRYTINITNNGPDNATNVVVTDKLDPRLDYKGHNATIGSYSDITGNWTIGTLIVGQTATLTIDVQIIGTGTVVNIATVSVNEVNIGNNTTDGSSNFTTPASVNLSITKVSTPTGPMTIDDIVVYTITVRNYGPDNATGVVVTDVLHNSLQFLSANLTAGSYVLNGNTFVWNIGSILVNQTVTLNIEVRIIAAADNISNVANVTNVDQENLGNNSSGTVSFNSSRIDTIVTVENITQNATRSFTINGSVDTVNSTRLVNGFVIVNITHNNITNITKEYNVTVTNGKFTLTDLYFQFGIYNVNVVYFGDTTFNGNNGNGTLDILQIPTTISVKNDTAFVFMRNTSFTAILLDVWGNPLSGVNVEFYNNATGLYENITTNSNGRAVYVYDPGLDGSTVNITVTYIGNGTYMGSTYSINVTPRPMEIDIIVENVTDNKPFRNPRLRIRVVNEFGEDVPGIDLEITIPDVYGNNESFNVTTGPDGVIIDNYTTNYGGNMSISVDVKTTSLPPGSVIRDNSGGYINTDLLETTLNLRNIVVTTLESAAFSLVLVDEDGRLLANKVNITIYIDGVLVAENISSDGFGRIYVDLGILPLGIYNLTVHFPGNPQTWARTNVTRTLTVRPVRTVVFVTAVHNGTESTNFVATLRDAEHNRILVGKTIIFFLNGIYIGSAVTDHNGIATLPYKYTPGGKIAAEFLGDYIYREYMDNRTFGGDEVVLSDPDEEEEEPVNDPPVYDIEDIDVTVEEDKPISGIAMLNTGNPIAMILLCLLSIFFIGFNSKRKE